MNAHDQEYRALAAPARPFQSRTAYEAFIKQAIERAGHTPIRAHFDPAGNCTICGEAGRCPGWHASLTPSVSSV